MIVSGCNRCFVHRIQDTRTTPPGHSSGIIIPWYIYYRHTSYITPLLHVLLTRYVMFVARAQQQSSTRTHSQATGKIVQQVRFYGFEIGRYSEDTKQRYSKIAKRSGLIFLTMFLFDICAAQILPARLPGCPVPLSAIMRRSYCWCLLLISVIITYTDSHGIHIG